MLMLLATATMRQTLSAQNLLTEGTVVYKIDVSAIDNQEVRKTLAGATQTLYIKGNHARYDFESAVINRSVIIDSKMKQYAMLTGSAADKYLTNLTEAQWYDYNKKYGKVSWKIVEGRDTTILGYKAKLAELTAQDGTKASVYFTRDLVPAIKTYDMLFKDLDGLPLYYAVESTTGKLGYLADNISMNPVNATKFQLPTSGYKILEVKKQ